MKNIIIKISLMLSIVLLNNNIYGQTLITNEFDQYEYLYTFEANKSEYIGKTFSTLLNDMKNLQPVTCFSMSAFNNKNLNIKTIFNFVKKGYANQLSPILQITWQESFPSTQATYFSNKNKSTFTGDERFFYGSKIIKDIKVY